VRANPVSRKIAKSRADLSNIKIGVELETQSLNGETWKGYYGKFDPTPYWNTFLGSDTLLENAVEGWDRRLIPSTKVLAEIEAPLWDVLRGGMSRLSPEMLGWDPFLADRTARGLFKAGLAALAKGLPGVREVRSVSAYGPDIALLVSVGNPPEPEEIVLDRQGYRQVLSSVCEGGLLPGMQYRALYGLAGLRGSVFEMFLREFAEDTWENMRSKEPENWREGLEHFIEDEIYTRSEILCDELYGVTGLYVGATQDDSVNGPELQFPEVGGASVEDVKYALKKFFENYKVEVDEGCSFHIHISDDSLAIPVNRLESFELPVDAMYTQLLFLTYLWEFSHRYPLSVVERIADRWREYEMGFFMFQLGADKYLFVAPRSDTWEFRSFGNVDNYEDACACIDFAVDAYRWAHHPDVREKYSYLLRVPRPRSNLHAACGRLEKLLVSKFERLVRQ